MKIIFASLLLIFLASVSSQEINPPEVKFAFDFNIVDALKSTLIKPFFDNFTKNGIQIAQPVNQKIATLNITLSNIWINNITLDWENTHFLAPEGDYTSIVIKNLSATIMFDGSAINKIYKLKGKNNTIDIGGTDIKITFGFGTFANNQTSYAFLVSQNISIGTFSPHLTSSFAQCLVLVTELLHIPLAEVVQFVIKQQFTNLNQTVIDKSAQGLSLGLLDMFEIDLSLADKPFIYQDFGRSFQAASINVAISNNITKQSAPVAPADLMPEYADNSLQFQLLVSENMIDQLLWTVFQSGKVDITFSSANLPSTLPISLNTTNINILLPNVTRDYGEGKGMYLQIQKGGDYPVAFVRDGRIVAKLAAVLDFYVDNDGSNYPGEGLKNCTTCVKAVSLNATVLAAFTLFKFNESTIGVKIMNVGIVNLDSLVGDTDADDLMSTLNNLLVPIVVQLNTQLESGILNPLIGKYGISDCSIIVDTDYLLLGLSMNPSKYENIIM